MTNFEKCQSFVLKWEGGLTDDAADSGGLTKYGVSWAYLKDLEKSRPSVLREILGTSTVVRQTIKDLTKDQAWQLFKYSFWDPFQLDTMPLAVALCAYDMNVNHGSFNCMKIIQRAANLLPSVMPKLAVDGRFGPKTRSAMNLLSCPNGIGAIANKRQSFYDSIVANRPSQRVFIKGWTRRCNDMKRQALEWL